MLFTKTFLLVTAMVIPSALAACNNAPYQGTCNDCVVSCHDDFNGPGRQESLQRSSCQFACLALCDDCD
ncbi:hypothetical protein CkaCkLH20_05302 [Colletotrichum karsti]|uniref:Uncharacterized protein n=1 Tax=Colletotrichum karsti TaxID=1095194 RepID=A0A9P6LLA6_9PEZI|nr:uncharacterized protein CkaCkLH20_05302 [Colletotrichum karsti]KAF9877036.1 hypothetical protein CkaCkLH20_05302 [Colletotrichum karsti]